LIRGRRLDEPDLPLLRGLRLQDDEFFPIGRPTERLTIRIVRLAVVRELHLLAGEPVLDPDVVFLDRRAPVARRLLGLRIALRCAIRRGWFDDRVGRRILAFEDAERRAVRALDPPDVAGERVLLARLVRLHRAVALATPAGVDPKQPRLLPAAVDETQQRLRGGIRAARPRLELGARIARHVGRLGDHAALALHRIHEHELLFAVGQIISIPKRIAARQPVRLDLVAKDPRRRAPAVAVRGLLRTRGCADDGQEKEKAKHGCGGSRRSKLSGSANPSKLLPMCPHSSTNNTPIADRVPPLCSVCKLLVNKSVI
jgi:hypothetical protein